MDLIAFESYKSSAGAEQARLQNLIVAGELPLVRSCVRRVLGRVRDGETDDLVQVGLIAAAAALRKWDPTRGVWPAYARKWVTEAVRRALPEQALIHVPVTTRPKLTKEQMANVFAIRAGQGREATPEEIGVDPEVFAQWRAPAASARTSDSDEETVYPSVVVDPDLGPDMVKALNTLEPLEQRVLLACAVEGKTLREVAAEEHLSNVWVMKVFDVAAEKMRDYLEE